MEQHYELLYIISSRVAEREQPAVAKKVHDHVVQSGGTVTMEETLGSKKLAYEINHEKFGTYVRVEFDAESETVRTIDKELRLVPEVVRHLAITKRVKTQDDIDREQAALNRAEARKEAERKDTREASQPAVPPTPAPLAEKPSDQPKEEKPKPGKQEKISLEDLDKKLDEILKEDF